MLVCPSMLLRAEESEPAKPLESKEMITSITADRMLAILKEEGYSASADDDGDIVWKLEGFKGWILIAEGGESIQFHSAFSDGNATLKKVNDWNRTKRYSRTYLDDEGDPHLELDLDMVGGVGRGRIVDFLSTCRVSFVKWRQEVVR